MVISRNVHVQSVTESVDLFASPCTQCNELPIRLQGPQNSRIVSGNLRSETFPPEEQQGLHQGLHDEPFLLGLRRGQGDEEHVPQRSAPLAQVPRRRRSMLQGIRYSGGRRIEAGHEQGHAIGANLGLGPHQLFAARVEKAEPEFAGLERRVDRRERSGQKLPPQTAPKGVGADLARIVLEDENAGTGFENAEVDFNPFDPVRLFDLFVLRVGLEDHGKRPQIRRLDDFGRGRQSVRDGQSKSVQR